MTKLPPIGAIEGGIIVKAATEVNVGRRLSLTEKILGVIHPLGGDVFPNRSAGQHPEFLVEIGLADVEWLANFLNGDIGDLVDELIAFDTAQRLKNSENN